MRTVRCVASALAILVLAASATAAHAADRTERVSISPSGQQADAFSAFPVISGQGRYVAFEYDATNLVANDSNGTTDIFRRDRKGGTTVRISVNSAGAQANESSRAAVMSRGGRYVAFASLATNLVPNATSGDEQVYLRDVTAGTTVLVSVGPHGEPADGFFCIPVAMSANGQVIAFSSDAANIVAGAPRGNVHQIYVRDMATGVTTLESQAPDGKPGDATSDGAAMSADGRWLAFDS